jgi:hypothetical protein
MSAASMLMTGHAFQVFIENDELRASLAAVHAALGERGRFAFESRNPLVREWERWTPQPAVEVTDASGAAIGMEQRVEAVEGDRLSFTLTSSSAAWSEPRVSRSVLRFLDAATLASFLAAAGFAIEEQFGDWDGQPFAATSREIITIARRR